MKTVLVLAAHFPPSGGVGVIRTLNFVKYLPDFGWKPIVVTYSSWIKGALPGSAVMISAMFFESSLLTYGLSIVGFALMIWLHLLWVPLVRDQVPIEK